MSKSPNSIICYILTLAIFLIIPQFANAYDKDWANFSKYRQNNIALLEQAKNPHRIVFMGDSITEFWDKDFFTNPNFVNRGISGQTTPQMLLRFRPDVIALKPEIVVILAGTNDIAGNTGPATNKMIEDNIASMVEIAKANKIKVILCTLVPASRYYWAPEQRPAPRIVALNKWIKEYARANKITFVDYNTPMNDGLEGLKAEYSDDGVHPNKNGYLVMNDLIRKAISKAQKSK